MLRIFGRISEGSDKSGEDVLSAMELGGFCLLSYAKDLRMGPAGGLHVAAMLAVSWEGGAAHAEDDL